MLVYFVFTVTPDMLVRQDISDIKEILCMKIQAVSNKLQHIICAQSNATLQFL